MTDSSFAKDISITKIEILDRLETAAVSSPPIIADPQRVALKKQSGEKKLLNRLRSATEFGR